MPVAVLAPPWARPYEQAVARADASIALVTQSTVGFAILALQRAFGPPITVPARSPVAVVAIVAFGGGMLLAYLGLLGAALAVPMWMHRCYRNLPALGSRGHFSPAWAAGCWFVPIANLVLPYLAVRDIWADSRPGGRWNAALVAAWWIAWLAAWGLLVAKQSAAVAGVCRPHARRPDGGRRRALHLHRAPDHARAAPAGGRPVVSRQPEPSCGASGLSAGRWP